jgi:hypothetical protein
LYRKFSAPPWFNPWIEADWPAEIEKLFGTPAKNSPCVSPRSAPGAWSKIRSERKISPVDVTRAAPMAEFNPSFVSTTFS